jgi:Flp pilus assembly pilin Flp
MSPFLTLWSYLQIKTDEFKESTKREDGVVAVEYVILAAAIILVVGAAVVAFGGPLKTKFQNLVP